MGCSHQLARQTPQNAQPARGVGGGCGATVQAKLRIGAVNDPLEREADRAADSAMRGEPVGGLGRAPAVAQRLCAGCGAQKEEEPEVQRKCATCGSAGPSPSGAGEVAANAVASAGAPLTRELRHYFEPRFGRDFGDVRVHTGGQAAAAAAAIGARAYTLGANVAFAAGQYAPSRPEGRRLIAHELAHVAQQSAGDRVVRRDVAPRPPMPVPDLVADPTLLSEPGCPRLSTRIGNITPTPPCPSEGEDIDGIVFSFCSDSDVFSDPGSLALLRSFAQEPSGTTFSVRTYASTEGPGTAANSERYNRNLSCHRRNRVVRELINLGIQEAQIDAVSMGPTDRFGSGVANHALNRIAVINTNQPARGARPDAAGMSMQQIADAARARLTGGDYPLAADGYTARWSCGRWRTLSEAVARSTVLIEGLQTQQGAGAELGTTTTVGPNTIVLSPRIAGAIDPIGCAANRIADLTFHHFSRPVLESFTDQHQGGMHLVHLAGLPSCQIPLDPLNINIETHSTPRPVDQFLGFVPRCADQPLAGPMVGIRGPSAMDTPPTFTLGSITLSGASGAAVPSGSNPLTVGVEPISPFIVNATVDAAGPPAEIAKYDIGMVQTVMAETWINTHVDGRRERRRFPLPLRDGPGRNEPASDPPWFDRSSRAQAVPGANASALIDAPNFRAFRFLPDLPSSLFFQVAQLGGANPPRFERATFQPRLGAALPRGTPQADIEAEQRRRRGLLNNPPDRGERVLEFNTWVVARRRIPPAAPTVGETQFLGGLRLRFRLDSDWSANAAGDVEGRGSYSVTSRAASAADSQAMMLRGATPLDFVSPQSVPLFAEFLDVDPALPRAQAGGMSRRAYFDRVAQIVAPHRTGAFLRGEILIELRLEAATGRLMLDSPDLERRAVRVLDTDRNRVDTPETQAFLRTVFPELRKLVAGPSFHPSEPQSGTMPLTIRLPALGAGRQP